MFLSQKLLILAAAMTLSAAATAQFSFNPAAISVANTSLVAAPPALPSFEARFGEDDRSIGNSWLGGSVYSYAGIVRQKQGTYHFANAQLESRAVATLLGHGMEVAELVVSATNIRNNGVPAPSAYCRLDLLGFSVFNSATLASGNSVFNLFGPNGVTAYVWVGPVSIMLRGNVGCGFNRALTLQLPTTSAKVVLSATGTGYAFADANVGIGVPGFGVGVGIQGKIYETTLTYGAAADAVYGLSGTVSLQVKAISLRLYAWAQLIWTQTTDLCTWSAGVVNRLLFTT